MVNTQFAVIAAVQQRNFTKAIQVLMGICSGLIADGKLDETEILFLQDWIKQYPNIVDTWPGNIIAKRLNEILEDGIVTDAEKTNLLETLQELTGNYFLETGVAQQDTPTLPIDIDIDINFNNATVCFTGECIFGTRAACQKATEKLGAISHDAITKKLDYLIIGSLSSPDWVNTTFGRKIEKAVAYRSECGKPLIISEKQWNDHILQLQIK